jgi:cytochrome c-type biogenesis protein
VNTVVAEPGWGVAFAAGMVSFLSPCVAPLAPGYLAFVAGAATSAPSTSLHRHTVRVLATALLFMLGFTIVFVALGTSVSLVSGFFQEHRRTLYQVAGGSMIVMGLLIAGVVRVPFLYQERQIRLSENALGPAAPVLLGMAFALAWTPCVGPVLGSILFYASTSETTGQGGLLLFVYSLGFGIPFVLAGVGFATALRVASWARRHYNAISLVSGLLVMGMGVLLLVDRWSDVNAWTQRLYNSTF